MVGTARCSASAVGELLLLALVALVLLVVLPLPPPFAHAYAPVPYARLPGPAGEAREGNAQPAAAPVGWSNLTPLLARSPGRLGGSSGAYDPPDRGTLFFGGNGPGGSSNETWLYNSSGWVNLTASAGPGPSARAGSQMTWDPEEGGVLLYGGIYPGGSSFGNDTWLFRSGLWSNLTNSIGPGPGPRGGGAMADDPVTGAPILFGGASASYVRPTTTWAFDNGSWQNVTSRAGSPPTGRVFDPMATDPAEAGVLLYGGQTLSGTDDHDTWLFRGGAWHAIAPTGASVPGDLRGGYLAYDSTYGVMVLFGGDTSGGGAGTSATWTLSSSNNWADISPQVGFAPGPRWTGGIANDPSIGGLILFGGCQHTLCIPAANDTWSFVIPSLAASLTSNATSFDGGTNVTTGVLVGFSANVSGGLPPRSYTFTFGDGSGAGPSDAADAGHTYLSPATCRATVTVRDESAVNTTAALTVHVSTLGSEPISWHGLCSPSTPSPRGSAAMAFDLPLHEDLLFGGVAGDGAVRNDTWALGLYGWVNLTGSLGPAPPARSAAASWYDPGEMGVILFGGEGTSGNVLNDTWVYNGTWTNVSSSVGSPPSGRFGAASAYDSTQQRGVLFGGTGGSGASLGDTWSFQSGRWVNITQAAGAAPSPRSWASAADDLPSAGLLLFGGSPCGNTTCGDTWVLQGSAWSNVSGAGPGPSARRGALLAYDSEYGADVLFGGDSSPSSPGVPQSDTWVYAAPSWSNLTGQVGTAPAGRWASSLVDDGSVGGVVVFGGCSQTGCLSPRADTWELTPRGPVVAVASQLSNTTAPAVANLTATGTGGFAPLTFSWDFGDGSYENHSLLDFVQHTYGAAGTYRGNVTVVDLGGSRASAPWSVIVTAPASSGGNGGGNQNRTAPNGTTPLRPTTQGSALPLWGWVLIAVGAAAGVAIVAVGVFRYRRRPASPSAGARASSGLSGPPTLSGTAPTLAAGPSRTAPSPSGTPKAAAAAPAAAAAAASPAELPEDWTLGDRILVHLHRQGRLGPDELAPVTFTQAGLAAALGRPQSAFARTLQRLEGTGLVFTELRHVRGAARRLKAYRLTNVGEQRAAELRTRANPPPKNADH